MSKQDRKTAAKAIADSAQQIWLAGLGAFAKAQAEGSRLFDQLIDEGTELEKSTRKYTRDKVDELRGRMETTAERLHRTGRASIERIQAMIDQRVEQAVDRLAVPSREDIDALAERMRELGRQVAGAGAAGAAAAGAAARRGGAAPSSAGAKRGAKRPTSAARKTAAAPASAPAKSTPARKRGAKTAKTTSTAAKSTAKKSAGKKATAKKSTAKRPAPAKSTSAKPAATRKSARKAAGKRAAAKTGGSTSARSSRSATRGRGRSRR